MTTFPAPPKAHVLHVPGVDPDRDAIVSLLVDQGEVCLHPDPERNGCMWNWLTAVDCARDNDTGLSWSLILSDDAMPLRGWQQHVERACVNSPQPVVGLTHFGGYGQTALDKGAPYGEGKYLLWGGAIGYNRAILPGLAAFARSLYEEHGYPHDDVMVCAYMMKIGAQTAMTARAVFDQPVKKSLLNHNTPIRNPTTTITNSEGPEYTARPRSARIHRGISPKGELERLMRM